MILTGKANKYFEKWANDNDEYMYGSGSTGKRLFYIDSIDDYKMINTEHYIYNVDQSMQYAQIIEWLDSVGIYVDIQLIPHFDEAEITSVCWYANVATSNGCYNSDEHYPTRQQATEEAIKQANKIYNNELSGKS